VCSISLSISARPLFTLIGESEVANNFLGRVFPVFSFMYSATSEYNSSYSLVNYAFSSAVLPIISLFSDKSTIIALIIPELNLLSIFVLAELSPYAESIKLT